MAVPELVRAHKSRGRHIEVGANRIFVRDEGTGPVVLLVHGVPSSSFLFRKMITRLASSGLRVVAFDFLGTGLSDKPRSGSYDWHSQAELIGGVLDALDIREVHLVVHDIGGPIGVEWAVRNPDRVRSLTVTNTLLNVAEFRPPFPMWMFRVPLLRHIVFATLSAAGFLFLMRKLGVRDGTKVTYADMKAWIWLLKTGGGRRSFLSIMDGFRLTEDHAAYLRNGLRAMSVPIQTVWGVHDVGIPISQRDYVLQNFAVEESHELEAAHFLQEEVPEELSKRITDFVDSVSSRADAPFEHSRAS
ncbi:MAG: alpha/beta fold hydrolase [Myxococcota bacterium]